MAKTYSFFRWRNYLIFLLSLAKLTNGFAAGIENIPLGKNVQIGHNSIYAVSFGEGQNVIFESGLGASLANWKNVAPVISKNARVILYDRAGIGNSHFGNPQQNMRTAQDAVNDLLLLLKQLNAKPPYILVGHSLGGLYVQLFAREHPEMVSGVVLVDSMSPDQMIHDTLPNKKADYYSEAIGITTSEKQVRDAKPFPKKMPLIVLSATIHGPINGKLNSEINKKRWANWQEKLSAMSTESQHITANNTGHCLQLEKPWLVIAAINEIISPSKKSLGCEYK